MLWRTTSNYCVLRDGRTTNAQLGALVWQQPPAGGGRQRALPPGAVAAVPAGAVAVVAKATAPAPRAAAACRSASRLPSSDAAN